MKTLKYFNSKLARSDIYNFSAAKLSGTEQMWSGEAAPENWEISMPTKFKAKNENIS